MERHTLAWQRKNTMTVIEGIGDEVIQFFVLLLSLFIALVAWWSTSISERPLLRTVLILERRGTRHASPENQAASDSRDTSEGTTETNEPEQEGKTSQSVNESNNQIEMSVVEQIDNFFVNADEIQNTIRSLHETSNLDIPDEFDGGILAASTTNECDVVRNRRITYFKGRDDSPKSQSEGKMTKSTENEGSVPNECEAHSSDEGSIRIRLKYLNDDQKLVEGRLHEQLGDFKRRHFSLELAGRKLVRLIFNGKVLQQDSTTLKNYGLYDNCVVHCLVHQPRTPPPSPNMSRSGNGAWSQNEGGHPWDLGNVLFAGLSVLLCLAWYGRYQYAQLYTATSTVALIGLTGMFTVSLIGMYMPNADSFRTQ